MFDGTVSVQPLFEYANQVIALIVPALLLLLTMYVLYLLHTVALKVPFLGRILATPQMQKALADGLNTALKNGMAIALHQLQAWEDAHKDIQVQGAVTRMAAQYAIDHAPGAIAHFGLSPQALADKALAFLPPPPHVTLDIADTAKVPAATVTELPPIKPQG